MASQQRSNTAEGAALPTTTGAGARAHKKEEGKPSSSPERRRSPSSKAEPFDMDEVAPFLSRPVVTRSLKAMEQLPAEFAPQPLAGGASLSTVTAAQFAGNSSAKLDRAPELPAWYKLGSHKYETTASLRLVRRDLEKAFGETSIQWTYKGGEGAALYECEAYHNFADLHFETRIFRRGTTSHVVELRCVNGCASAFSDCLATAAHHLEHCPAGTFRVSSFAPPALSLDALPMPSLDRSKKVEEAISDAVLKDTGRDRADAVRSVTALTATAPHLFFDHAEASEGTMEPLPLVSALQTISCGESEEDECALLSIIANLAESPSLATCKPALEWLTALVDKKYSVLEQGLSSENQHMRREAARAACALATNAPTLRPRIATLAEDLSFEQTGTGDDLCIDVPKMEFARAALVACAV